MFNKFGSQSGNDFHTQIFDAPKHTALRKHVIDGRINNRQMKAVLRAAFSIHMNGL
jgi:hypothetical protein